MRRIIPYINKIKRECYEKECIALGMIITDLGGNVGDLNYVLTKIVHIFIETNQKKFGYELLNSVIGILECMKLELYAEVVKKYEDKKKQENGAISELDKDE